MLRNRSTALCVTLACTATLAIAACGTTNDISNSTHQGVNPDAGGNVAAEFVSHADSAIATFDTEIFKPYKAGKLTAADKSARAAAQTAAVSFYRALQLAAFDAESSDSLSSVVTQLKGIVHEAGQLSGQISRGQLGNVNTIKGELGILANTAAEAGSTIK